MYWLGPLLMLTTSDRESWAEAMTEIYRRFLKTLAPRHTQGYLLYG